MRRENCQAPSEIADRDFEEEVNEEAKMAGAGLIVEGERYELRRKTFIYVNNRLEGNALETIATVLVDAN